MNGAVRVKICGLSSPEEVAFAVREGADYVGLVSFAKSARHVPLCRFRRLTAAAGKATAVVLTVNPQDHELDAILRTAPVGMIQLHGTESAERVRRIRKTFGIPVMKAVGLRNRTDLEAIEHYSEVADQLLVDTKSAPGARAPGGSGVRFDWTLIENQDWKLPWMLAGGLDAGNVATAIRTTRAGQVDVSTGVEFAPGRKDLAKIAEFISAAKGR